MEKAMLNSLQREKATWFSMWFLASIASFGVAFFPMFWRLVDSRNKHFRREAALEAEIAAYLRRQGKEPPAGAGGRGDRNAKAWAASIILVIPVFFLMYYLSKDLQVHEQH